MKIKSILLVLLFASLSYATLSTTYTPAQYNCDGGTTEFSFPYTFFSTSDLEVYLVTESTGATNKLAEGAGLGKFTVYAPNADYSSGARITTGSTYSDSYRLVIARNVPYGQSLDINGDFVPAEPLEQQLDKLAAQTQQIKDSIGRTITAPVTDPSSVSLQLPAAEARANQIAYFDATGSLASIPFVNSGVIYGDGTTVDISASNVISVVAGGITSNELSASVNARLNTAFLTNIPANSVGSSEITNEAVTFAKLTGVSTNVSTTSQTNLVTEGAVKAYADTKVATASTDWTAWTPVVTQGASTPTFTNGYSKYSRIGSTITATTYLTFTSSGTSGQEIEVSGLPIPARAEAMIGSFELIDGGTANYIGVSRGVGGGSVKFFVHNTTGAAVGGTPSFAIASGDKLIFTIVYEEE